MTPALYWSEHGSMFCRARPQQSEDEESVETVEDTDKSEFPAPGKIEIQLTR